MAFKIGVLSAENSLKNMRYALDRISPCDAEFIYLPYPDLPDVVERYRQNQDGVDAFLFSGELPYRYICSQVGPLQKPYVYADLTPRDYYRTFLRFFYQNRGLNIERVLMDKPSFELPWKVIFGDHCGLPSFPVVPNSGYSNEHLQAIQQYYIDAYRDRRADFIITGSPNSVRELQKLGIPCEALYPSPDSILQAALQLLKQLETRQANDRLPAVCVIPAGDRAAELCAALEQLNRNVGDAVVIRRLDDQIEITTNNLFLRKQSDNYTQNYLRSFLEQHVGSDFLLGWGVGVNVVQAHRNAMTALSEARRSRTKSTFVVTETGLLIGPMENGTATCLSLKPNAAAEKLAKKIGTSATNAQKLLQFSQSQETVRLNRNQLAKFLNITTRTANRLLNNMCQTGCAGLVGTEQQAAGRPIQMYELAL